MEVNEILAVELKRMEALAKSLKSELKSGSEALKMDEKPRRMSIDEGLFSPGDILTIPKLPEDDKSTANQWVALPISKDGDPVLRVLVDVENNGVHTIKSLFAGTLGKTAINRDDRTVVKTGGNIVEKLEKCATNADIWATIAGHKLEFVSGQPVPIIRRGWNGQPDRQADTTIWTINVID